MPAAVAVPLITGAIGGAATITGAKMASSANKRATEAQAKANADATALAQQQEATRKSEYDAQVAEQKRQFDITEQNKLPYRQASQAALMKLGDLLGLPAGAVSGVASASAPSGLKGSAADLKAMIDSGLDPQAAAAKFNQQFGRSTGNEAKYYGPEVHGTPTIGLPDAYLSLEQNGWSLTPRDPNAPTMVKRPQLGAPNVAQTQIGQYQPLIPFKSLMVQ